MNSNRTCNSGINFSHGCKDLAGMFHANARSIEQSIRFHQCLDGFGRKVLAFESDDIHGAGTRRKAFDQHVRRNVVQHATEPADEAVATDRSKVMHSRTTAERRIVLDMDMSTEHDVVGHDDAITDFAVVRYVLQVMK